MGLLPLSRHFENRRGEGPGTRLGNRNLIKLEHTKPKGKQEFPFLSNNVYCNKSRLLDHTIL